MTDPRHPEGPDATAQPAAAYTAAGAASSLPQPAATQAASPTRRHGLLLGAAAAALAAGAAVSLWRGGLATGPGVVRVPADGAQGGDAAALAGLWQARFARPDGSELAMASLQGRPLLINFWATWCAPCVRELPLLDAHQRAHAAHGLTVLALAIDGPTPVRDFLQRTPLGLQVALAGLPGTELARSLGNAQGGLPFSVLIGAQGQVLARKTGELQAEDLARWATLG